MFVYMYLYMFVCLCVCVFSIHKLGYGGRGGRFGSYDNFSRGQEGRGVVRERGRADRRYNPY